MASGKMSGSPFHVETVAYKYAAERSDVPVAKSVFNQTITKCTKCAYCYDKDRHERLCTNISGKNLGGNHCEGFVDIDSVINLMVFKNESLEEYYCYHNHRMICGLVSKLGKYKPGNDALIDSYYGKRWIFTGINKTYNKEDLFCLVRQLNGKHWSNMEHWDISDSDIVVDMGGNPYKLKKYYKEVKEGEHEGKNPPRIITIQELRKDIRRMTKCLSE